MMTIHYDDTEPPRMQSNWDIAWRGCALGLSVAVGVCIWAAIGFWLASMLGAGSFWRLVVAVCWPMALAAPALVGIEIWRRGRG